ncbi:MAG: hypothetical protein VR73_09010 [Gammaproteobacteria bacterium BRH_c0]|nr:MAG: hypothetical protein VR73_09010 [Gammaproteobacteria bacterium BRH_c0]
MSYQVLARKWRPRTFTEMVGQEHVLKALINGLDHDRLHHAYLFTGTRGVGKTTLARIIAKCLNCEKGVSSTPCGECSACKAIAEGRFVDLLEVDAASRTKVEDTREMLDNVQYLPTNGRYKVYLIDEVHMLSTHSFNALLKTLEEPPPHVKFLLATTDPQKLPVTILSRCLQFNLKNLNPERIVNHLRFVLGEEKVPFEDDALWALGRGADGSMRDALSLTDQAIAHGGGQITLAEVSAMLGTIDRGTVVEICEAVTRRDVGQALALVQKLADHAPDYSDALAEMLSFWHRLAIAQTAPDALDQSHGDHHRVLQLSSELSREDVQLFYQITLLGRRDLPFAADPRSGFEMVLLRLLAFQPLLPDAVDDAPPAVSRAPAAEAASPAKKPEVAAPPEPGNSSGSVNHSDYQPVPQPTAQSADQSGPVARLEPDTIPAPEDQPEPIPPAWQERDSGQHGRESSAPAPARQDSPGDYDSTPPWEEYEQVQSQPPAAVDPLASVIAAPQPAKKPEPAAPTAMDELRTESTPVAAKQVEKPPVIVTAQDPAPLAAAVNGSDSHDDSDSHDESALAPRASQVATLPLSAFNPDTWFEVYQGLEVGGLLQNIAANLELVAVEGSRLRFILDNANSSLYKESDQLRLAELLGGYFSTPLQVDVTIGALSRETPTLIMQRRRRERQQAAVETLRQDPHVKSMMALFGGQLLEDSVKPID